MANSANAISVPRKDAHGEPPKVSVNKQGFFCIWHGLTFGRWLKLLAKGPHVYPLRQFPRISSVTALSLVNSAFGMAESLIYGGRIARKLIDNPPVFILGHWRSGTTLLHNLMTLDPRTTSPNLYECMYPGSFLLTEDWMKPATSWLLPKMRPMDNIAAGWDLPQEDEFALLLMSLVSPYLMLAFQDDLKAYRPYLNMEDVTPDELAAWKQAMLTFTRKLMIRNDKSVVFKSPSHTYRVPLLLELFPDAKFIYIYREPYAVYNSSMHLRRTTFAENSLWATKFDHQEEHMLAIWRQCIDRYEQTKSMIPAGNLHELRFEDLEDDPMEEMSRIYSGLNLPGWSDVQVRLEAMMPELKSYKKNKFVELPEETRQRIYEAVTPAFECYGYPSLLSET